MTCRNPVQQANEIIRLSDGTTTIDFKGAKINVMPSGVSLPPPLIQNRFVASPFVDGDRLASSRYSNRLIRLTFFLTGRDSDDVRDSIRSIERLLNDARKRLLLGQGDEVFLEYQWGLETDESVFYDVLSGELILPPDFSFGLLWQANTIVQVELALTCKPFGRFENQTVAQATLENEQDGADVNYLDIATSAEQGDVPARLYVKIVQNGAAGSKKVWLAKRTGIRQTDDLFIQGEDEDAETDISPANLAVAFADVVDAAYSAGEYKRISITFGGGNVGSGTLARLDYDIAIPPRGQFRVLIRCRSSDAGDTDLALAWGVGWSYGDKTKEPSEAAGEVFNNTAIDTDEILDLGIINIPPIPESDIASNNTFQLRIFGLKTAEITQDCTMRLDYIFLLPIDEGVAIIDDVAAADVIAMDGISERENVFIISAADVIEDLPDIVGAPFSLGRESTRIYVLRDDLPAVTFTVDVTFQPQFLVV